MSEISGWKVALALAAFMMINFIDKIVLGLVAVPMMDELRLTPQQFGFAVLSTGGSSGTIDVALEDPTNVYPSPNSSLPTAFASGLVHAALTLWFVAPSGRGGYRRA